VKSDVAAAPRPTVPKVRSTPRRENSGLRDSVFMRSVPPSCRNFQA
jgi:hypothetical protein